MHDAEVVQRGVHPFDIAERLGDAEAGLQPPSGLSVVAAAPVHRPQANQGRGEVDPIAEPFRQFDRRLVSCDGLCELGRVYPGTRLRNEGAQQAAVHEGRVTRQERLALGSAVQRHQPRRKLLD